MVQRGVIKFSESWFLHLCLLLLSLLFTISTPPPFLIFFLYFQLFKNLKVICCATQKVVVVWILPLCGYSLIH